MVNEVFDITDVKNEYLIALEPSLKQQFTIQALEAGLVLLHDFCNNVRMNNIVLVKINEQPQMQQPQMQPTQHQTIQQRQMQPPNPFGDEQEQEMMLKQEVDKQIKAEEMRKRVEELNKNLKDEKRLNTNLPPIPQVPTGRDDINIRQDKPKNFMERVRQYKTQQTDINQEEDEDDPRL